MFKNKVAEEMVSSFESEQEAEKARIEAAETAAEKARAEVAALRERAERAERNAALQKRILDRAAAGEGSSGHASPTNSFKAIREDEEGRPEG